MPQPGEPLRPQPSAEDCFLDLLAETLEGLEENVRGPFLQRFFKSFSQIDLSESRSIEAWAQILERQKEFSEALGRRVALKTALVDVLGAAHFLRVPVLLEYDAYKKLQINAATDSLTGLYNRRLFDETCERELNRAKRYNQQLATVLFDLRNLKEVNDQYGHLKGDQVLQLAAANLRKTLRVSDFAFRIGGDEFALLLPQTDPEQASAICRRVRDRFEGGVEPLKVTTAVALDFGMAVYPQDAGTKEDLVQRADERLYALKHSTKSPRVIPIESPVARETAPPTPMPTPPAVATPAPHAVSHPAAHTAVSPKPATQPRKWERVSLAGTKSYAVLDGSQRTASVIDLSYGGVALLFEKLNDLPEQFSAVLHVPILPPLRVSLRKAYSKHEGGNVRIGCAFVA